MIYNITEAALWCFRQVLDSFANLLPTWNPVDFAGFADAVKTWFEGAITLRILTWLNFYLPISESVIAGIAILGLYDGILIYNIAVWVLTKAHVLGGS